MEIAPDLIGQIFGRIRVVSRATNRKKGYSRWNCECSCGTIIVRPVTTKELVDGIKKSCGCLVKENNIFRTKDLSGLTFGRLYVLSKDGVDRFGSNVYLCQCCCDEKTFVTVSGLSIKRGTTKSCGCIRREVSSNNSKSRVMSQETKDKIIASRSSNKALKAAKAPWSTPKT